MAGTTECTTGIATPGTQQPVKNTDGDAFLVKFSDLGVRQWGTYYGASGTDKGNSLAVDGFGNIFLAGVTNSISGMATSGAHQTSLGSSGMDDAFLAQFNNSGILQWSTYYGGETTDNALSVATDGAGNAYIAGIAGSRSGIATPGAHQAAHGGNTRDRYLAKFNNSGIRQWATYYGGEYDDDGWGVATDLSGNVYLSGVTGSRTGIASSGSYQSTYAGGTSDSYLASFNSSGTRRWGTYFGGTESETGHSVVTSGSGIVYLMGTTTSLTGISTPGSFQPSFSGDPSTGQNIYLAAFDGASMSGINSLNTEVAISAYPNPAMGTFTIQTPSAGIFFIYSLEGKELAKYEVKKGETILTLPIEVPTGVYMGRYVANSGAHATINLVYTR